jgi:hypothetical protein
MMKRVVASLLGCVLLSSPSWADIRLSDYKNAKASGGTQWEFIKTYFLGAGNAYQWANAFVPSLKKAPLFCPANANDFAAAELPRHFGCRVDEAPAAQRRDVHRSLFANRFGIYVSLHLK